MNQPASNPDREINEAVEELDPMEVRIDPETGEILEGQTFDVDKLPRIGQRINFLRGTVDHLKRRDHPINKFISKLTERRDRQISRLENEVTFFLSISREHIDQSGDRKLILLGVGRFRYRKMADGVDVEQYDGMDQDMQREIQHQYPELFRVTTTHSPDIKSIKEALAKGRKTPGFSVKKKPDIFEFKGE